MRTPIEEVKVSAYQVPTDAPESDGTFEWSHTTMVVVEASAGGAVGLGYTYADTATAVLVRDQLAPVVRGRDALDVSAAFCGMVHAIRNLGRPGISSMAIAAVDVALWDLKARLVGLPLVSLFGAARREVGIYGSGGFTSYSEDRLCAQLGEWAKGGLRRVKMKVGRDAAADRARVAAARRAIGPEVALFVDANGAYSRKMALAQADSFAAAGVTWFEEPVSSDDLDGLRLLRDRGPAAMDIAAGEYGYDVPYFRRMLDAGAVDVLQADATRCAGYTGFLQAAALCEAHGLALSAHCAPALHLPVACAAPAVCHIEYFHDHVRIEEMLLEGVVRPTQGALAPDLARPGHGLRLKRADAARFAVG
ncbi:MAG TPA: enolase C-terminal domain-like protein [Polyangiaceae bacterium]|jgi:L-alanine-DL-glutamate epimerase-like enolase superfamily enzyme